MQNRIVLAVFIVALSALAFLIIARNYFKPEKESETRAKLVVPTVNSENSSADSTNTVVDDGIILTSLVPLQAGETLIDIVSEDFNGDGLEDQVNAIKTANSPYLQLLIGIYNAKTERYERKAIIGTHVSQVKTFSYYGIDLTGTNRMALLYQGFTETGSSVLQAYFFDIDPKTNDFKLHIIADLESDGAIYLQQGESSSYAPEGTGAYTIMVYGSDTENPSGSDQIQSLWNWSAREQKYVQTNKIRIKGSKIAAEELSKIQDGTVKTMADYLNGLWYKTEAKTGIIRYIFFDYESAQIIFSTGQEEEVYNWANSSLHYRGIYISSTNFEIETLKRNINVNIADLEQINIAIHDDVSMVIKEESAWNGSYKKMKFSDFYKENTSANGTKPTYIESLERGPFWQMSDGTHIIFTSGTYRVKTADKEYSGTYTPLQIENQTFIQFRTKTVTGQEKDEFWSGIYQISYSPSIEDDSKIDDNRIIIQPYTLTLTEAYATDGHPFILTRGKQN